MKESKEKTEEEVKKEFLDHIRGVVHYWSKQEGTPLIDKLNGVAFSILTALDGCANLPGFIVAPCPHEDDKEYHISSGDDYYPENHESNVRCDISGSLHDDFYQKR